MIKNELKNDLARIVRKYLQDNGIEKDDKKVPIIIGDVKRYEFGDYAANVAMILASKLKKNPLEIANELAEILRKSLNENIEKIEVAPPGYINFYLRKDFFAKEIENILQAGEKWGELSELRGKKYLFEHSSPNLFKPFHIGHLVNNSIGESLVRILRNAGAEVQTVSFPSDVSPGIAKTVWAIKEKGWERNLTIEKVGKAYAYGVEKYDEDERARAEIDEINKNIYLRKDFPEKSTYEKGYEKSLQYFKKITKRLGSEFDGLIFESEAEKVGKEIVLKNTPNIFKKSDGAIIFPGSKFGLFDNVFINSAGFGTYLTKDIGLLKIKFERFVFDKSITITDVEQREHFQLVKKVAEIIDSEWAEKSEFVQHGRLRFSGGKVSSRYGNVPLAEDVIDSVKKKVIGKINEQKMTPDDEKSEIVEKVAIGALKYSILKSGAGKNIIFDFKKSISFEGDAGPYLQYTYVRTFSILRKFGLAEKIKVAVRQNGVPDVEKTVVKFPQAIKSSLETNSPHHLANFLFELASEFNSFYSKNKVLDERNEDYLANVALTKAVNITLKNGLYLLGIEVPEKM